MPCAHCVSCACIPFQPGTNSNHREGERVGLQLSFPNLRALSNLSGCTQSRFPRSFAHVPATLVPVWACLQPHRPACSLPAGLSSCLLLETFSDPDPSSRVQLCFHTSWQRQLSSVCKPLPAGEIQLLAVLCGRLVPARMCPPSPVRDTD